MENMSEGQPGVIFDVDGVLIDSYQAHFQSWLALADETGCHRMTEAEFRATFGRTSRETIAELWPGTQLAAAEIAALDDRKEVIFRSMLEAHFQPIPGAAELIVALKDAGFAIAAGSSGPPENVFLVLDQLRRQEWFDAVVTGTDVSRGKPHPEVFLSCAERLGLPPVECAVIEDAVVGIDAANRAGCLSIALVVAGRDTSLFGAARHIVRELTSLSPARIVNWLTSEN